MRTQLQAIAPSPVVDALGRPLRDLRISVMETCNYRCPYCMPEGSVDEASLGAKQRLDFDDIVQIAAAFVAQGVRKIRLTGGEPLLRRNLPELIGLLKRIDGLEDLALTTNGSLLATQAQALRQAGLDRITVSVDALDETLFRHMSGGRGSLSQVLEGVAAAERAGFGPIKINCVVQRGLNESQILPLFEFFKNRGHVMRFIEYMDVGSCNGWLSTDVVPVSEILACLQSRYVLSPMAPTAPGEVAARYAVSGSGEVGFIASVSAPFCGDCNRARLSVDGKLFTCLFASAGFDLKPHLRSAERLSTEISTLWRHRTDRYSEIRHAADARKKIEMFFIGG
ncbi:MAG: GTP 3',8-cyclase MoaA [Arenimonas sp.]|jgi:cyclic pyranopterin phosphate synthase|nr:GTP 3',8-cyclase MoaA [Arenimonas sp.]